MTMWVVDTTTISIVLAVIAIVVVLIGAMVKILVDMLQRLTAVETNVNIVVDWVACLNGEVSSNNDYVEFNKRLKKITRENACTRAECKERYLGFQVGDDN